MKKYLNIFLVFSLILTLGLSPMSYIKTAYSATTNCVDATGVDTATNTPCSLVVIPCLSTGFNTAGKPCKVTNSGNTVASPTAVLKIGSKNTVEVKRLQVYLAALGLIKESQIDGKFGTGTLKALKSAQARIGVRADGIMGAKTANALNKAISKSAVAINLLKKFKVDPIPDPATGSSGAGSGSGSSGSGANEGGSSPSASAVCGPNDLGAGAVAVTATTTSDNWYQLYTGNADGSGLSLIGGDITGLSTYSNDHALAWASSQTHTFAIPADKRLYLVNYNDNWIANGFLSQFIYKNKAGGYIQDFTKASNWEMLITKMDKKAQISAVTLGELETEIGTGDWEPAASLGKNGIGPWGMISGINALAEWLDSAGVTHDGNKITIWRTKKDGAPGLDDCGPTVVPPPPTPSCPAGQTGTPPNCVSTCAPGTIGTPPNCVAITKAVSISGQCRGIYPTYTGSASVKFSSPVTVVGSPRIQVQPDGLILTLDTVQPTDQSVKSFIYVTPTPNTNPAPLSSFIGPIKFLPLPAGTSIKANGADVDLSGEFTPGLNVSKCPVSEPTPTPTPSDTYVIADLAKITHMNKTSGANPLKTTVSFKTDKDMYVIGTPAIKLVTYQGAGGFGVTMTYDASASSKKELVFSHTSTSGDGFVADQYSFTNYEKMQFAFPGTSSINTLSADGTKYYPNALVLDPATPWPTY